MLDEIIPGEIYMREDGVVMMAYLDGGQAMNCIAFKSPTSDKTDGSYRWMKSGVRPETVPPDWDKNPIAGQYPVSDDHIARGYKIPLAFIECISSPTRQPEQLDLFDA